MLSIPEKSEIIDQIIYESLDIRKTQIKNLKEFGYFTYIIYYNSEANNICMAFKAPGFKEILEYSGREFLEKEFKDFLIEENPNVYNQDFDVQISVNVDKFSSVFKKKKKLTEEEANNLKDLRAEFKKFRKETAEKFSYFRIRVYASVLEKMLSEIKEKKEPKPFKIYLNKDNILYILPSSDRIQLIYGINFSQKTDIALTKVFLKELVEAKRYVKNCIDAKIYIDNAPVPNEIANFVGKDKYSNGLVVFDLYVKDYNMLLKRLNTFITLREYIQFHIHSIKTFLHIRMNKKGREIENKLNACRIIPLNYLQLINKYNFIFNSTKKKK